MSNPIKTKAKVESVIAHGEGVYTVEMAPEGRLPRFKAGQFLHLTVDDYDPAGGFWPESRVFSIASPPGGDKVSIVYSVKGAYTRKMERHIKPGIHLWLKMPYGEFIIKSSVREGQDIVLVAGGTGISPFIPFLNERLNDDSARSTVALYYGARLRSYILFPELLALCARNEWFRGSISIENETSHGLNIPLSLQDGQLSIDGIFSDSKKLNDPVFFLSGPPTMIRVFKQRLADKGVAQQNIKIDEWE